LADKDDDRPLFLRPTNPEPEKKEPQWSGLRPGKALRPRHRMLVKLLATGCSQTEICAKLNYTQAWVSLLANDPIIVAAVAKHIDDIYGEDIEARMKSLAPDALNAIEEILMDERLPAVEKENAARWLLEKVSGKAAQQIDVRGEVSVGIFMDKLEQMKDAGQVLDATPKPALGPGETATPEAEPVPDPLASWVKENL
jgi:hypothetical protein